LKSLLSSPRIRIAGVVAATAVLIVVLAVWALQRSSATPVAEATAQNQANRSGSTAAVGDVVPPIEATSIDGRVVTVPADQPTVLFFMASWCGTCVPEARALAAAEKDYAGRVQFIAVNVTPGDPPEAVEQFRQAAGNPAHPYVTDDDGTFVERYAISALDTTVVVDADGRVKGRIDARPLNEQQLRRLIDTSLR
jgi:thiol-disulfide isomerase/thioredoxin